jgi:hypothetical protein
MNELLVGRGESAVSVLRTRADRHRIGPISGKTAVVSATGASKEQCQDSLQDSFLDSLQTVFQPTRATRARHRRIKRSLAATAQRSVRRR